MLHNLNQCIAVCLHDVAVLIYICACACVYIFMENISLVLLILFSWIDVEKIMRQLNEFNEN